MNIPESYISGYKGKYTVIFQHSIPLAPQVLNLPGAIELAESKGIQIKTYWNGDCCKFLELDKEQANDTQ